METLIVNSFLGWTQKPATETFFKRLNINVCDTEVDIEEQSVLQINTFRNNLESKKKHTEAVFIHLKNQLWNINKHSFYSVHLTI